MSQLSNQLLTSACGFDHAPSPPSPTITQAELARFQELKALLAEQTQLRNRILDKHAAGAVVEPGNLYIQIKERSSKSFSFAKLANLLGEQQTNVLKSQIEPTASTVLKVLTIS